MGFRSCFPAFTIPIQSRHLVGPRIAHMPVPAEPHPLRGRCRAQQPSRTRTPTGSHHAKPDCMQSGRWTQPGKGAADKDGGKLSPIVVFVVDGFAGHATVVLCPSPASAKLRRRPMRQRAAGFTRLHSEAGGIETRDIPQRKQGDRTMARSRQKGSSRQTREQQQRKRTNAGSTGA